MYYLNYPFTYAKTFSFSVLLPLTTFLMICQHFPPLLNPIFVMNSIVISAPTLSMLPIQSLGGTGNASFILISIAWHWITSLFWVSLFIFKFFSKIINMSTSYIRWCWAHLQSRPTPFISYPQPPFCPKHPCFDMFRSLEYTRLHCRLRCEGCSCSLTRVDWRWRGWAWY